MNKYSPLLFVMIFSFLFGDANVQIRLQNGQKANGEFVGTYMNHVHILVEEKIIYYACDDIISITYFSEGLSSGRGFNYDCSKNTVTADILFPPELDPMTGEMTQMLPDVFNPDIPKPAAKVEAGGVSTEPHPKVNSDLKNISISHLTKEQKKKYNQNRITMLVKNPIDWSIYRGQEELYLSEFFIFTGYPEKAEIVKHNAQLKTKNMWRGCGWYSLCALIGLAPPLGGGSATDATDDTIEMGIVGGLVGIAYFFYDYNEKKLEGASLKDAKIIAEKYNNDLIQRIFNEND